MTQPITGDGIEIKTLDGATKKLASEVLHAFRAASVARC
jgi:hypothetical protein